MRADDVVRQRGYKDHFFMMYVCTCVEVVCWHVKTKTPYRNDLNLGTVVVLDNLFYVLCPFLLCIIGYALSRYQT